MRPAEVRGRLTNRFSPAARLPSGAPHVDTASYPAPIRCGVARLSDYYALRLRSNKCSQTIAGSIRNKPWVSDIRPLIKNLIGKESFIRHVSTMIVDPNNFNGFSSFVKKTKIYGLVPVGRS